MSKFRVSASELRAKAEQLRTINAQFRAEVANLESQEQSLIGMWEGEAKTAFDQAFKSDKVQMDSFYNAIELYAVRLDSAAAKYAQTESTNVEIAREREY